MQCFRQLHTVDSTTTWSVFHSCTSSEHGCNLMKRKVEFVGRPCGGAIRCAIPYLAKLKKKTLNHDVSRLAFELNTFRSQTSPGERTRLIEKQLQRHARNESPMQRQSHVWYGPSLRLRKYSSCGTWWHTGRNQISSFPETDESI